MFPSLSYLFDYLFGIRINFPIQTLGFFIALAFVAAYIAFVAEFKRKEELGLIHAFKKKVIVGNPPTIAEMVVNAVVGFIFGYKIIGIVLNYNSFVNDAKGYIISLHGNLIAGVLCGAGWAYWAYHDRRKEQLPEPEIIEQTVHPYQLMPKITFWAGVIGFIGAKLFDSVEHIGYLLHDPIGDIFSSTGFTYYGGFLFGMLTFFYIGVKNGMKLAHVSDTGAPGIMLAYGVGRIGCQLSGDGDWGISNLHPKPALLHWLPDWMWAFQYPHNILNQDMVIPGCLGNYCSMLRVPVYPTPFYEAVICIGLFIFLWLIRKHIRTAGLMSFLYLILIGIERFLIEEIRVTIKYHVLGLTLSQAQMLSAGMFLVGVGGVIYLYRKNKMQLK
jgi:phosphatidylglycerol:prolipoprotein diacylglycerol transferase